MPFIPLKNPSDFVVSKSGKYPSNTPNTSNTYIHAYIDKGKISHARSYLTKIWLFSRTRVICGFRGGSSVLSKIVDSF